MAVLTQADIAQQMVAQLRLLYPSISAEVGTPERAILDTFAQGIADEQIDLVALQSALDLDSKFGANLDRFIGIFGFQRQVATAATGYVVFSRNVAATQDITVPTGTLLQSTVVGQGGAQIQFTTTAAGILPAGTLQTAAIPITATQPGAAGNVPVNTITIMPGSSTGTPVLGITGVTNAVATSNGRNQEDDNSLKVRFRNTVFRNLAGTRDQYLALAVATAFSTKANVVGSISQYQEYIQVPPVDDTQSYAYGGLASLSGDPPAQVQYGSVASGTATLTLPSTANIQNGWAITVYAAGLNPAVAFTGTVLSVTSPTTLTLSGTVATNVTNGICLIGPVQTGLAGQYTTTLSTIPYAKGLYSANPVFISNGQVGISQYFFRQGVDFTFNTMAAAKQRGDALRAQIDGTGYDPVNDPRAANQPNVTFTNVYTGTNTAVQAITPNSIVLVEYAYLSSSSRNDLAHNVTNAVDVFVDGSNPTQTSAVFTAPFTTGSIFVDDPTSMYYLENYRRDGLPTKRPVAGNTLTPLFQEPILGIPSQITIGDNTYYLGWNYWLVHDVSNIGGTVRARDGIEWSSNQAGQHGTDLPPPTDPTQDWVTTGSHIIDWPQGTAVSVPNYTYDQSIRELQGALEGVRQITTDVLAHNARTRYFKLDITVMYTNGANITSVNNAIATAVQTFLQNQYFGAAIQLSDLLQQIHDVNGVDNVRWSNDVPNTNSVVRVYETDINGSPLLNVTVDRLRTGSATQTESHGLYFVGQPTGGSFTLTYGVTGTTAAIAVPTLTAATIQSAINGLLGANVVSVTEDVRSAVGVTDAIRSFAVTWAANGGHAMPTVTTALTGGEYIYDWDFFLRDDELPSLPTGVVTGDTVAGLIIRPRAQGTWTRSN